MPTIRAACLVLGCLVLLLACRNLPADATPEPEPTAPLSQQSTPTLAAGLPTAGPPTPASGRSGELELGGSLPTLTPLPTVTPLPSPTPSPQPAMRLTLAETALHNGDYAAAIDHLLVAKTIQENFTASQQLYILYQLGVALQADGRFAEAVEASNDLLHQFPDSAPTDVHLRLGQLHNLLGNAPLSIAAYRLYLAQNPEMAAYVEPMLAQVYESQDETAAALAAYEAAAAAPAQRLREIANRQNLAQLYLENGRFLEAVDQYDAVRNLAKTEFTQGQMNYLAGMALLAAEDSEGAYGRFRLGLTQYPRAYESYLGLVALVEAEVPVDEFQRGVVNFNAQSYLPAIAAFDRLIAGNPTEYPAEAHLYLGWSHEALGNQAAAQAALRKYAELEPEAGLLELARWRERLGETAVARQLYLDYLDQYPDGGNAAQAAWQAAELAEKLEAIEGAIGQYAQVGTDYPDFPQAAEALFRAGWLAHGTGNLTGAIALWHQLIRLYPGSEYGGAGLVWLQRVLPGYEPLARSTPGPEATGSPSPTAVPTLEVDLITGDVQRLILTNRRVDYYWLRATGLANEQEPFAGGDRFRLPVPFAEEAARQEAEAWLGSWLLLEEDEPVGWLSPQLTADFRLIIGQKLWDAGLFEEAKGEFEDLRRSVADDALLSYQLALYFRDIGLYRSSILAAASVLTLSGQTIFEAPKFIGQLAYPVYYADLILPLADQYGFDPRLQFSLVRQESLFESFARSGAAAQGLSQVIPDTGVYIANLLNWPDYVNEDLYKPYVGLNFGAFYLDQQLNFFDGYAHAALAAYNGGPGNAARWYEQAGGDLDQFVEVVNFPETRLYIERIFTGFVIYDYLYGH